MQRVYTASDPVSANVLKAILESHGIEADVQDERTFSLRGDVPMVYPSLWVGSADVERARELVAEFEKTGKATASATETWTCPTCGETHSTQYTECWKCTAEAEGKPEEVAQSPLVSSQRLRWTIRGIALIVAVVVAFMVWRQARRDEIQQCVKSGCDLMKAKRYEESLEKFNRAIELDARYWQGYYNRACVYWDTGRWKDCETECTAALDFNPHALKALVLRGRARRRMNYFSGARDDFTRVVYLDEKDAKAYDALLYRSDVNLETGQWPAALADLNHAAELPYSDDRLLVKRGSLRVMMGFLDKGMADLDRAVERNPEDAKTWCTRAWARLKTGKPDEALTDISKAETLKTNSVPIWTMALKACGLSRTGKHDEAVAIYGKIVSAEASKPVDVPRRGYARARTGQFSEAMEDCERGKKEKPWSCWPNYWTACVLAERSKSHPDDAAGSAARDADIELGIANLTAAMGKGLKYDVLILNCPEFDPLRQHPKFAELKKMQDEARADLK